MPNAKYINIHSDTPPLCFEPAYKTIRAMRRDYHSIKKTSNFLAGVPNYCGISPTFLGVCNFRYMVLKDCDGLWSLPLYDYGLVYGYILNNNSEAQLPERYLCHTSRNFAWIYDDFGNITQFKADLIKFYCVDNGFVIAQIDLNENTEES